MAALLGDLGGDLDSSEFSSLKVALFWILLESYNLHKGLKKPLFLQFDGIEILHERE